MVVALKVRWPSRVVIIRGNHESRQITQVRRAGWSRGSLLSTAAGDVLRPVQGRQCMQRAGWPSLQAADRAPAV